MTSFSTEVRTLFRLLEDDQWHNFKDLTEKLAATIAPGKALRKYQDRRDKRLALAESTNVYPERSEDEKVLFGQRLLANAAINGVKVRYLEYKEGEPGGRQVRLKPGVSVPRTGNPLVPGGVPSRQEPAGEPDADPEPEEPEPVVTEVEPVVETEVVEKPVEEPESPVGAPEAPPVAVEVPEPVEAPQRVFQPPPCHQCGAAVVDYARHRSWHEEMERTAREIAMLELEEAHLPEPPVKEESVALFSEQAVRQIVAQEVGTQLDAFQSGFQDWLSTHLAEQRCPIAALHQRPL